MKDPTRDTLTPDHTTIGSCLQVAAKLSQSSLKVVSKKDPPRQTLTPDHLTSGRPHLRRTLTWVHEANNNNWACHLPDKLGGVGRIHLVEREESCGHA